MRITIHLTIALIYLQFVSNLEHLGRFTDAFAFLSGVLMIIGLLTVIDDIYRIISHFDTTKDYS